METGNDYESSIIKSGGLCVNDVHWLRASSHRTLTPQFIKHNSENIQTCGRTMSMRANNK